MANNSTVEVTTIESAKEILNNVFKTNIVPFLWGPPGVGKSTLMEDICKERNWKFIDFRLALVSPVDLRGIPYVDKEKKQSVWFPPEFLPKEDDDTEGLLFLDELNLAPTSVQGAAYQLILNRKLGEYTLPKKWKVAAAGNRSSDKANVYKLSAPLANRFVHLEIAPDYKVWKQWAEGKVNKRVIKFLDAQQSCFYKPADGEIKGFPTPRSWDFVSQLLKAFDYDGQTVENPLRQAIIGAVGEGVGKNFIEFLSRPELDEVREKYKEFIETGKITDFPKTQDLVEALLTIFAIKTKEGELSSKDFDKFCDKYLNKEQAEAAKIFVETDLDLINDE